MKFCLSIVILFSQAILIYIPIRYKKLSDNRRKVKMTWAGLAMCACAIIITISGIAIYCISETEKTTQELKASIQRVKDLRKDSLLQIQRNREYAHIITSNQNIISSQKIVIDSARYIIRLERDLRDASSKITQLQNQTFLNITGGNGIPYVHFIPYADNSGIFINVRNMTDYTLKNVSIELSIEFLDLMTEVAPGVHTSQRGSGAVIDTIIHLGDLPLSYRKFVFFYQRKTKYKEISYMYKVNWLTGFYHGDFTSKYNDLGTIQIVNSRVTDYSKGLKLSKLLYVSHQEVPIVKK